MFISSVKLKVKKLISTVLMILILSIVFYTSSYSIYAQEEEDIDLCPILDPQDTDGDGIFDSWEQEGIDINNDNQTDMDLNAVGANPLRKDLYVHVDYMEFHRPLEEAIDHAMETFASAPVCNPDKSRGITLHVEIDEQISHQNETDKAGLQDIKNTYFGTIVERSGPNHENLIAAKKLIYHYALFAHDQKGLDKGSSGIAMAIPGMDFMVTLGSFAYNPSIRHNVGTLDDQEGTFLHELGHTLGLRHGGDDNTNFEPNYLSVMNYAFQFSSLVSDRPLDYSRCALPPLNEQRLNESAGIGPSCPQGLRTVITCPLPDSTTPVAKPVETGVSISYDEDNIENETVARDLNNFRSVRNDCDNFRGTLDSFDDWSNLVYRLGDDDDNITLGIDNTTAGLPIAISPTPTELTADDVKNHTLLLVSSINNTVQNLSDSYFVADPQEGITAEDFKDNYSKILNPENGTIANLIKSDNLDEAIDELENLKTTMDGSFGGSGADDAIQIPEAQKEVASEIINLQGVLEKRKY